MLRLHSVHPVLILLTLFFAPLAPAGAGEIRMAKDIPYIGEEMPRADLYLPKNPSSQTIPAVVIVHGGGWDGGSKSDLRESLAAEFLASSGYAVLSIDYPLSGEGAKRSWPENLLAVKAAVRWLRVHADSIGIDPKKIALFGASSGGQLAAVAAMTGPRDGLEPDWPYAGVSTDVTAVVLLYPILVVPPGSDMIGGVPKAAVQASPMAWVRPNLPPFLILQGDADTTAPYARAADFSASIDRFGGHSKLLRLQGARHGFRPTDRTTDLRAVLLGFLDSTFGLPRRTAGSAAGR